MLLVRSQTGASSVERVHYLTRKPSFDALRKALGSDDALLRLLDERVEVVDGDFSRGQPDLPGGIDVTIHSAATVAFDPPIDEGFQTNLLGAMNLYRGVLAGGSRPALVHVSTAYVAGVQKGVIPERTLDHRVDWRLEADLALQSRHDVEAASRKPELLERFLADASKEHSRAGPTTVAEDAEQRRKEWMTKRLVEYGRQRARSLGWPDVYTFTKAMGERAVEELAAEEGLSAVDRPTVDHRVRVAPSRAGMDRRLQDGRPDHPAYGLGQIPEFPGIPEGIVDIIPVDFVVNAILAVAATPPPPGEPAHYHVSSGDRNPLQFHQLYSLVREYFEAHPLPERGRGQHKVPEWTFPGNITVEKMLRRAEQLTDIAEKVVTHLPKSKAMRDAVGRVDRDKARVDFVKRYSDLYGAYTEAEVIYTDDVAMALYRSLSAEDRARFPFDAAAIDWKYYLQDVHSPGGDAVAARARAEGPGAVRRVKIREREDPVLAVFDMEGTIISSNVVESYVWARMADLEPDEWPGELVGVFGRIPRYLAIDRRDRGDFLRTFFRRYEGASVEGLDRLIDRHVGEFMLEKASPGAIRRIREHRAAGHRTLLAHRRRERVPSAADSAVRRRDRRGPPGRRGRPVHRVHVEPAARR